MSFDYKMFNSVVKAANEVMVIIYLNESESKIVLYSTTMADARRVQLILHANYE